MIEFILVLILIALAFISAQVGGIITRMDKREQAARPSTPPAPPGQTKR